MYPGNTFFYFSDMRLFVSQVGSVLNSSAVSRRAFLLLARPFSKSAPTGPTDLPTQPQQKHFPIVQTPLLPSGSLKGRVALVSGGGTGLGRAMAEKLAAAGASVCITSRKLAVLEKTAEEIRSATGNPDIFPLSCNVRDPRLVEEMVEQCTEHFKQLPSLIVNNSAANFISPTERLSFNAFQTILETVLHGTVAVTLATGKRLIQNNQRGAYLAISTVYAETGSGFVVPSACSKAGVETLYKSLAAEWGRYGLRFNVIAPGPVYTRGAFSRLDPSGQFLSSLVERIPCGRVGHSSELANLAAYMLSDYASFMNGSVVKFDGGENCSLAGEFNMLGKLDSQTWDQLEKMIRDVKGS